RIDVETSAGLDDPSDQEPNYQRQGRHHFKIDQGLPADTANFFEITHGADAVHEGAENYWRDHHLDQCDEAIGEGFEGGAGGRESVSDSDAQRDRRQDLDVQNAMHQRLVVSWKKSKPSTALRA